MLGVRDEAPEEVGYLGDYNDGSIELQEIIEQNGRELVLDPASDRVLITA